MKPSSDQQHFILNKKGNDEEFVLYKAAIAVSNIGSIHPGEVKLSACEVTLLEVRRQIFKQEFAQAETLLQPLKTHHPLLEADKVFLTAQIFHRRGDQPKAYELMNRAGDLYQMAFEPYRELRARVNGAICVTSIDSSLFGELYSYEQEARRLGFMDLAANICRDRSMVLLVAGRLSEAHNAAMESADLYRLDGYPDDRSVSIVTGAIALLMNDEQARAQHLIGTCLIRDGKVKQYLGIYEALLQGKTPKLHKGHPLAEVKWKKNSLKKESVPGKIVNILKESPKSKDDLIIQVWGEGAQDISYVARLHTAIKYLRKTKGVAVTYDGEKYQLAN
jgi:hypothetical protein